MTNIIPLFARVVVQPKAAEEQTKSGIILPETANKERPMEGTVLAVGADCKAVKKGDTVVFKKYSPTEFELDGEEVLLVDEEDLLAKVA